MTRMQKLKEWIETNAPMFKHLYQNKYVGMVYDRFISLPGEQQKQLVLGVAGIVALCVLGVLFSFYLSLWTQNSSAGKSYEMVNMLLGYQKSRQEKGGALSTFERNAQLGGADGLRQYLLSQGRSASISPRMIQIEAGGEMGEDKAASDIQMQQAIVKLQRVNLTQLKTYLQNVEFGPYTVNISSLKVENDTKLRGYLNAQVGVITYIFSNGSEELPMPGLEDKPLSPIRPGKGE